ncbi:MAG: cell division ATP-binding protein FtsE [Firmicutes bacterium]|nr:cell division ATP-binding protein FtsE [Bacillota bacterium]MBQ9060288.1 cell division ATP-binding protein FtsE [Bacillota bacterium]
MIEFNNVTKYYRSNVGLDNVTVHIKKGDFVFLVGPSGAGKSTFIKLILKELDADKGTIKVRGEDVTKMAARQIPGLRRNIGIVFQDFRLLPKKTVYENVAFAMEIIHAPRKLIRKHVPQVLSMMGIAQSARKYPDELSAGEQQRVAIARAIVNKPRILIADEPTGNLDPDTAWEIMQLLNMINLRGTTILMVTHAKDIVDKMEKRVIAIENGRIVRDEFGMYGYKQALMGDDSAFAEPAVRDGRLSDTLSATRRTMRRSRPQEPQPQKDDRIRFHRGGQD